MIIRLMIKIILPLTWTLGRYAILRLDHIIPDTLFTIKYRKLEFRLDNILFLATAKQFTLRSPE